MSTAAGWPAFDRQWADIYLVARLDGFTLADATALQAVSGDIGEGAETRVGDGDLRLGEGLRQLGPAHRRRQPQPQPAQQPAAAPPPQAQQTQAPPIEPLYPDTTFTHGWSAEVGDEPRA